MTTLAVKRCSKCGETKPTTEFWRLSREHDGLQVYCKSCMRVSTRESKRNARHYDDFIANKSVETLRQCRAVLVDKIAAIDAAIKALES